MKGWKTNRMGVHTSAYNKRKKLTEEQKRLLPAAKWERSLHSILCSAMVDQSLGVLKRVRMSWERKENKILHNMKINAKQFYVQLAQQIWTFRFHFFGFLRLIFCGFHKVFESCSDFEIVRTFPGVVPVAFWFVLVNGNNQHIESFYFVPVAFYFDNTDILTRL